MGAFFERDFYRRVDFGTCINWVNLELKKSKAFGGSYQCLHSILGVTDKKQVVSDMLVSRESKAGRMLLAKYSIKSASNQSLF